MVCLVYEQIRTVFGHAVLDHAVTPASNSACCNDHVTAAKELVNILHALRNVLFSMPTTGCSVCADNTEQLGGCFSTPSVMNLLAIWIRNISVGTTTSRREQRAETSIDSIVSVFSMPVGMTMVAGASDTDQCIWIA